MAEELVQLADLPFTTSPSKFETIAPADRLVHIRDAPKTLTAGLAKIADDIR